MDTMYLNGKQLLHIEDVEKFRNEIFISRKTSYEIWNEFYRLLSLVYSGVKKLVDSIEIHHLNRGHSGKTQSIWESTFRLAKLKPINRFK